MVWSNVKLLALYYIVIYSILQYDYDSLVITKVQYEANNIIRMIVT